MASTDPAMADDDDAQRMPVGVREVQRMGPAHQRRDTAHRDQAVGVTASPNLTGCPGVLLGPSIALLVRCPGCGQSGLRDFRAARRLGFDSG